jgi:predicted outer membrane repeat protein
MRSVFLTGILGLSLAQAASGTTRTVCPDGSGNYFTVQAAINASVNGDVIELCDATYAGDGNRDIDYIGKAITVRSQSGNPQACVIDCGGAPHRGFSFHTGEGGGSVLQGVTIRNGARPPEGGGIHCDGASPTIDNCILQGNFCLGGYGAGLFCRNSAPTLTDCAFRGNGDGREIAGGGMACVAGSSPVLTRCTFEANRAQAGGGGLFCADHSSPTLTACTFSGNAVDPYAGCLGGGLFCWNYASPALVDCVFSDNSAGSGGGVAGQTNCDPLMTNCAFSGNHSGGGGGAYFWYLCVPRLDGCTFDGNRADLNGGGYGGGLFCNASSPILTSCTFTGNGASIDGGGIHLYQSSPTLDRTIIAFSTSGAAVYCYGSGSTPTLGCCDVYGNAGGDWVGCIAGQSGANGNISLDPLFCDAANGDYRLETGSPCAPFSPPNPQCDLIGAWPVGCGGTGVAEGPLTHALPGLEVAPNPFTPSTLIRYVAPGIAPDAPVSLDILDVSGRLVRRLVVAEQAAGAREVEWDGRDRAGGPVAAGIYFARLSLGRDRVSRRLILVR